MCPKAPPHCPACLNRQDCRPLVEMSALQPQAGACLIDPSPMGLKAAPSKPRWAGASLGPYLSDPPSALPEPCLTVLSPCPPLEQAGASIS